jgi:Family of unknown function (DUF6868)
MDLQILKDFLMWCTIINGAMMCFIGLICVFGQGWVYRIHSRWFPMTRETFSVVMYSSIGLYKMLFFFFNVIPYVALVLATRG